MNKKIKIAIVHPPYACLCPSFDLNSEVWKYIQNKHKNIEFTYFVDKDMSEKFSSKAYEGINIVRLKCFDKRIKIIKPLNVILKLLGLPHYYYPGLVKRLKNFDLIESTTPEFHIFGIQAYIASQKYRAKYILHNSTTTYQYLFPITKIFILPLMRRLMKKVSKFLFTNPGARSKYEEFGFVKKNSKRSVIVGLPLNTDIFKPMNLKKYKTFTLISVGGLYKVKGHHIVIGALKKVVDAGHKEVTLHIYGKGTAKPWLEELVKKYNLRDNVKFMRHIPLKKLAEAYNRAHLFVLANLEEFTSSIGEAMLCNLPVVVMDCGSIRFIIPDDSYGFVTRRKNVNDMAKEIIKLIKNPDLRKKLPKKGRSYICKTLGYKYIAKKIHKAYLEAYNMEIFSE